MYCKSQYILSSGAGVLSRSQTLSTHNTHTPAITTAAYISENKTHIQSNAWLHPSLIIRDPAARNLSFQQYWACWCFHHAITQDLHHCSSFFYFKSRHHLNYGLCFWYALKMVIIWNTICQLCWGVYLSKKSGHYRSCSPKKISNQDWEKLSFWK